MRRSERLHGAYRARISPWDRAKITAFGHGVAVLPGLLRGARLLSRTRRDSGQRRPRPAGLHRPAGRQTISPTPPGLLLGQRLAAAWRVELIPSPTRRTGSPRPGDAMVDEMAVLGRHRRRAGARRSRRPGAADHRRAGRPGPRVVGHDGYEADDVIGTLAATAPMPVDVVTGDRDLFQVVDDAREVRVLYIARGVGKHERGGRRLGAGEVRHPGGALRRLRDAARRRLRRAAGSGRHRGEDRGVLDQLLRRSGARSWPRRAAPTPRSAAASGPSWARRSTTWRSRRPWSAVVRDLDLGRRLRTTCSCPPQPARSRACSPSSTELLGLGGSADRVVASLAGAGLS